MHKNGSKRPIPARAIASVLFSWCSVFLFCVYGQLHWLPKRFSRDGEDIFHRMLTQVGPIRDQLDIGYRVLAAVALAWCIWSWRTEAPTPAVIATVFAAIASFCAVFIVM